MDFNGINGSMLTLAGISVLTSPLAGVLVGYIIGVTTAIMLKYWEKFILMKPMMVLVNGAMSYMLAEILGFSSIFSLVVYGLCHDRYMLPNLSVATSCYTESLLRCFSVVIEAIVYLMLGLEFVQRFHQLIEYYKFCFMALFTVLGRGQIISRVVLNNAFS